MKIKIKVEDMLSALDYVAPVISAKSPLLAATFVKLTPTYIVGTSTQIEMTSKINATEFDVNEEWLVDFSKLYALTRAFDKDAFMTIKCDESGAQVTCQKSKSKLNVMPASSFPQMKTIVDKKFVKVNGSKLAETLQAVAKAMPPVGNPHAKPMINGVNVESVNGELILVATDGLRLNLMRINASSSEDFSFIIPARSVGLVSKTVADFDEEVTIVTGDGLISVKTEDKIITSNLIDMKYVAYDRIIPNNKKLTLKFNTDQFKSAIKKVNAVTGRDIVKTRSMLSVPANSSEMMISGINNTDKSNTCDTIPVTIDVDYDFEIGFAPDQLTSAIDLFSSEYVELSVHEPSNIMKLERDGDVAICVPVRF